MPGKGSSDGHIMSAQEFHGTTVFRRHAAPLHMVVMFNRYVGHVLRNAHDPGSGPIWLDDVVCVESCYADLKQCHHRPWGNHNCEHRDDVSIACYDRNSTDESTTAARKTTAVKFYYIH